MAAAVRDTGAPEVTGGSVPSSANNQTLSPRFVPDAILEAPAIPRTLTGKKQEVPIKKLLLGQPLDKVVNRDAMANPQCLAWYETLAAQRPGAGGAGTA